MEYYADMTRQARTRSRAREVRRAWSVVLSGVGVLRAKTRATDA
jgi:hypothetical protein